MYDKALSEIHGADGIVIKVDSNNLEHMLYYRDEGNVREIACNRMQLI